MEEKLERIIKENGSLEQEKNDINRMLEESKVRIDNLEEEAKSKEEEVESLREEKAQKDAELAAAQEKMESIQSELGSEGTTNMKPSMDALAQATEEIKLVRQEIKAAPTQLNKAQEELNNVRAELNTHRNRTVELETTNRMLEEQKTKLDADIAKCHADLKSHSDKMMEGNREVSAFSNDKLGKMTEFNNLLQAENLDLESSVQNIIKRLNNSIDSNNNLREEIIELSENIEELNYIELEDFIQTIKNIDDNAIRGEIEKEICGTGKQSKKIITSQRKVTRKAKIGRPLGSKNSYQRHRRTKLEASLNQKRSLNRRKESEEYEKRKINRC